MKKFNCSRCGTYLGEMTKGKIKKNTSILCESCMKKYETYKSLADYKNNTQGGANPLRDLFKGAQNGGLDIGNIFGGKE